VARVATEFAEPLKHAVSSFGIATARESAWVTVHDLWLVRDNPFVYNGKLTTIDVFVNTISQLILVPTIDPDTI